MKFKLKVSSESGGEWWEDYDKDIPDPEAWAKETVDRFNATLRPREKPRTLLAVEVIDRDNAKFHKWVKRTDGMSVGFRGVMVDLMYCKKCGITGKRYGLQEYVTIDSKFRKKAFRECHTAQIEMKKERE